MLTLYWLALILGGGLALFSLIGDFTGTDADYGGLDHDLGHGGIGHDGADTGWQLFSLRTATYFLFGFGATGVLVRLASGGPIITAAAALFTGVAAAFTSASVFRYLRRTSSGEMQGDTSFEGLQATVTLPFRNRRGKIEVVRGGREIELMAECYDDDAQNSDSWREVVIIEVRGGTARVSPLHQFERADALLPPAGE
jgi:hypothetical protein